MTIKYHYLNLSFNIDITGGVFTQIKTSEGELLDLPINHGKSLGLIYEEIK